MADRLLRRHLKHAAGNSPWYRKAWKGLGPVPARGAASDWLLNLPTTGKDDLALHAGEFLAVPSDRIVDVCLTSGTTGEPVAMLQTRSDLARLAYNEEISFSAAGLTSRDTVLICAAIDRCFMAGLAYFLGLTSLGARAIRGGSASATMLAGMVSRLRPTALVGVPSLMNAVAATLVEGGSDPRDLGVTRLICIGEPVRREDLTLSPLGERLREAWGAEVLSTYASTEMAHSFADCAVGNGGHLHPDLAFVEILDEGGNRLGAGLPGEVTVTPLQVEGMPLVRFRTGDVAALHDDPCPCGRSSPRLGPVIGRKAQMLKVRGTTLYPQAIFSALDEVEQLQGYYLEVSSEFDLSDRVRVVLSYRGEGPSPERIAELIAARTRVKPEVVVVPQAEVAKVVIQEGKRKPVKIIDKRGC